VAALSSAAGAETAISTTTIPAFAMPAPGWTLRAKIIGSFADNTNSKRVRVSLLNASFHVIYDTGAAAYQNSQFEIDVMWVARAPAQSWISTKCLSNDTIAPTRLTSASSSRSYDASNPFIIYTTGVAAADVVIQSIIIEVVKGSSEY
jgi:hypothetical protein